MKSIAEVTRVGQHTLADDGIVNRSVCPTISARLIGTRVDVLRAICADPARLTTTAQGRIHAHASTTVLANGITGAEICLLLAIDAKPIALTLAFKSIDLICARRIVEAWLRQAVIQVLIADGALKTWHTKAGRRHVSVNALALF